MSRPGSIIGTSGRERSDAASVPLRVVAERLSLEEAGGEQDGAVIPRARPAGRPVLAPRPEHGPAPAGPVTDTPRPAPVESAPASPPAPSPALPVLAPRPRRRRGRLMMLLRLVIPPRRGGRHRSGASHLQAWSMFAPHPRERRARRAP